MRQIRFFNTLGKKLEVFQPLDPPRVKIYTCGPTVYNRAHIGNLRSFLFEDLLRRTLGFFGYQVTQVMNLTDVDDKTIQGAMRDGVGLDDFTATHIEAFFADLDALGFERAERYPRATEHIAEMIELIERLIERDHAYVGDDGSVFFRIASDPDYGRLSGADLSHGRQGQRVAADEYDKEDARDFGLWKAAKEGEPSWPSPWGRGRPGWHIECSAMAMKYLGPSFDIHCGGVDNIFPHHENEIAQSESATGETYVHTWLHAEHLMVDGQKMSKSLGNFYTLEDVLEKGGDRRSMRYLMLSVHYRQKLNFTFESLAAAGAALKRVDDMCFRLGGCSEQGEPRSAVAAACAKLRDDFAAGLADDLNSAEALAALFGFVREVNRWIGEQELGEGDSQRILAALTEVDRVLGVLDPAAWQDGVAEGLTDGQIDQLVADRQQARADRDFDAADRLRAQLQEANVVIEDSAAGSRWRRR